MFSGFGEIWRKIVILVHFRRPITQRRSVRRRSAAAISIKSVKNRVHQKSSSFLGFKCLNRVVHARSTSLMKKQ